MILVVQFRTDQSGWHEMKCIYDAAGISYSSFKTLNVNSPRINANDIEEASKNADAVILGGMGEGGYEETDTEKKKTFDAVRQKMKKAIDSFLNKEKPVFGICLGHQLIAETLGAEVSSPTDQRETGVIDISLNEEAKNDKIFKELKEETPVILGHKSSVLDLPKGATLLASSKKCKIQAFKYGENVYGTQFHPELDYEDLSYRLSLYPEYLKNATDAPRSVDIRTKSIIKKFIDLSLKKEEFNTSSKVNSLSS